MAKFRVSVLLPFVMALACDGRSGSVADAGPRSAYAAEHSDSTTVTTRRISDKSLPEIGVGRNGRTVVHTNWDSGTVAIRELATGKVRNLTHNPKPYSPGYALGPRISRDGQSVAYGWLHDKKSGMQMRIVPIDGSAPKVVFDGATDGYIQVEDWSPDGRSILALRQAESGSWQIALVPSDSGALRVLKSLDWRAPVRMNFSPDGRYVVYDFPTTPESNVDRDLFVLDLANGQEHRLVQHPANDYLLGWGPDAKHVLFASDRSGTLGAWLQEVDNGRPKGPPTLVKAELWNAEPGQFTASGSYVYTVMTGTRQVYLATLDPATGRSLGAATSLTPAPFGRIDDPQWSPDGRSVSYMTQRTGTTPMITIRSLETGAVRDVPVPHELGTYSTHRWASDGKSMILSGRTKGRAGLFRLDLQTGKAELLFKLEPQSGIGGGRAFDITPDNAAAVYMKWQTVNGDDVESLVVRDLKTQTERVLFRPKNYMGVLLSVSRDGRMVAFTDGFREDAKLMIAPIDGGEARRIGGSFIPTMHSSVPWSPDGRSILAETKDSSEKKLVWRVPVDSGTAEFTGLTERYAGQFRIDPSGRRLLFMAGEANSELWVMEHIVPSAGAAPKVVR